MLSNLEKLERYSVSRKKNKMNIGLSKKELGLLLWVLRPYEPSDDWTDDEITDLEKLRERFEMLEIKMGMK